ncbi:MAG: hypothetical protein E7576_03785 [Ruminococcaceae bacterium]|nr:hypothetical protein [Oscillospiraceae bacterium]
MKKRMKSLICLPMSGLLLLPAVSCSQSGQRDGKTETDPPVTADPEPVPEQDVPAETEAEEIDANLPDKTFGGEQIMFLDWRNPAYDKYYTSREIYAEELDGTLINDAVFTRNAKLEDLLDVKIAETKLEDCASVARNSVKADEAYYNVVMPYMNETIGLATDGLLLDLKTVPWIDLSRGWWDQRANKNLLIADKLFITTGDIAILDNECTLCLYFNKEMLRDRNLENPYELVREHRWTLDKLREMTAGVTNDADGDGQLTKKDVWGLSISHNTPMCMYFGAGERIVDWNEEGTLDFCLGSARSVDVFDKIIEVCCDTSMLSAHTVGDTLYASVLPMFNEGRVMIVTWNLSSLADTRETEFEFGLLPMPLYDEAQEEYNHMISTELVSSVSVPVTCPDIEVTGAVLEAMASLSVSTLTAAYYDNALKTRYIRDEESGDMLDIIFSTRVYDIGYIYNWGSSATLISSLYGAKSTNIASMWAKFEKKARKDLEKAHETFAALE